MWFWIKHLSAAAILIALAVFLLSKPDLFKNTTHTTGNIKMAAAQEFTNFYEQIRFSLDATKDLSKEFIISLTDTSGSLAETLAARTNTVPPLEDGWTGKVMQRRFKAGNKIREDLIAYASAEDIELIWTLPRDYVVKHYFHSEGDYLKTLKEIASAIAPDFEKPVLLYMCPKERAAVMTDKTNNFLQQNCRALNDAARALQTPVASSALPEPKPN
ncbi:toxin co-regulated pilus biosynthesis Q family protein [Rheinheimera sp. 4Y26]|uniref:toxin co-regulated pilus biosynthesis Q family protein n=1 Tax=Rheinheimera sp. 4Y26 TaxID=2977811 RepID=UPI0021B0A251|nr:toxin co-regulated pilus biosynthesis Q family protein [Rheinheimera sp. 4Y26]MCT6698871.1 toxin co-regulated pilus biosynthesis Q family protein [Rheinheimera sp. 4Y26]